MLRWLVCLHAYEILDRGNNGKFVKARIAAGGMELHAAIPKNIFDFDTNESVWVCFAPDALHPLCGKRCRATETKSRPHSHSILVQSII